MICTHFSRYAQPIIGIYICCRDCFDSAFVSRTIRSDYLTNCSLNNPTELHVRLRLHACVSAYARTCVYICTYTSCTHVSTYSKTHTHWYSYIYIYRYTSLQNLRIQSFTNSKKGRLSDEGLLKQFKRAAHAGADELQLACRKCLYFAPPFRPPCVRGWTAAGITTMPPPHTHTPHAHSLSFTHIPPTKTLTCLLEVF